MKRIIKLHDIICLKFNLNEHKLKNIIPMSNSNLLPSNKLTTFEEVYIKRIKGLLFLKKV